MPLGRPTSREFRENFETQSLAQQIHQSFVGMDQFSAKQGFVISERQRFQY